MERRREAEKKEMKQRGKQRRPREMHLSSNLQTKMCIKIYDEFKSKMGDGLRDRSGWENSQKKMEMLQNESIRQSDTLENKLMRR